MHDDWLLRLSTHRLTLGWTSKDLQSWKELNAISHERIIISRWFRNNFVAFNLDKKVLFFAFASGLSRKRHGLFSKFGMLCLKYQISKSLSPPGSDSKSIFLDVFFCKEVWGCSFSCLLQWDVWCSSVSSSAFSDPARQDFRAFSDTSPCVHSWPQ